MKFQTDYDGYIKRDGCLVCSIVTAVEQLLNLEMSDAHFKEMLGMLHFERKASYDSSLPVLSLSRTDITHPGCYVWDHAAVFNEAFGVFGSFHRVKYTGRIYMPWWEEKGRTSFGNRGGDFIIMHILTPNTEHFRLPNFDPWRPGTKMVDLMSLRFYTLD